jgi:hypothetical protein
MPDVELAYVEFSLEVGVRSRNGFHRNFASIALYVSSLYIHEMGGGVPLCPLCIYDAKEIKDIKGH